jgi:hypothetical protein
MPKPFRGMLYRAPNCILERPALAAEIGNIAANWSSVEDVLMNFYALLMGTYAPRPLVPPPGGGEWTPTFHPMGYQIFDALFTLNARLDLLKRLIEWKATQEEATHFRKILQPRIRNVAKARNLVVHGVWGKGVHVDAATGRQTELPDVLILRPIYGESIAYNLADLQSISSRITGLRLEIDEFQRPIYGRIQKAQNTPLKSP